MRQLRWLARSMAIAALALEAGCDTPLEQPAGTPGTPGTPEGAADATRPSPECLNLTGCGCAPVMAAPVDQTYEFPDGSTVAKLLAMISGSHHAELIWAAPPPELSVTPPPLRKKLLVNLSN